MKKTADTFHGPKVSLADFRRESARYQEMAHREPIALTKRDRPSLVLLSFEDYMLLTKSTRRALHPSQLSEETIQAIKNSKMPDTLKHLDYLDSMD